MSKDMHEKIHERLRYLIMIYIKILKKGIYNQKNN